jgi:hypothetical protein
MLESSTKAGTMRALHDYFKDFCGVLQAIKQTPNVLLALKVAGRKGSQHT